MALMEEHERKRARVDREEWAKRVERWRDSGLTAAEFAGELGINPRTLVYWKWTLAREARGQKRIWRKGGPQKSQPAEQPTGSVGVPAATGFVQIQSVEADAPFEVELVRGRRVRVPASFDAEGLRRLLVVLEAT